MKDVTKAKLAIGSIMTALAAGTAISAFTIATLSDCTRLREKNVAAIVERYKACPDRYKTDCLNESEAGVLGASAAIAEKKGQFATAGMAYAMLNMANKAQEMADSCRANGQSDLADSIFVQASLRESAVAIIEATAANGTKPLSSPLQ